MKSRGRTDLPDFPGNLVLDGCLQFDCPGQCCHSVLVSTKSGHRASPISCRWRVSGPNGGYSTKVALLQLTCEQFGTDWRASLLKGEDDGNNYLTTES